MSSQMKKSFFTGVLIFMLLFISSLPVSAKIVPKVNNFVIFMDQSGSMYLTHKNLGEVKMILAKKLLLNMNDKIPELNYRCAVDLFASWEEVLKPTSYGKGKITESLKAVRDENDVYGRFTPMGDGISSLSTVLDQIKGKTAVILVSDGKANRGSDPVKVARDIYSKYPDICFHVISLADTAEGDSTLKQINEIGNCVYAKAADLLKDEGIFGQFVQDVFYEDVKEPARVIPKRISLRGVQFDSNSAKIKPLSIPVLDKNVEMLKQYPEIRIVIEAHTDSMGSEDYNSKLSLKRAEAIYYYFTSQGISANRMKAIGLGETRPIADNSTAEGRALNRRVEIQIIQ